MVLNENVESLLYMNDCVALDDGLTWPKVYKLVPGHIGGQ